MGSFLLAVRQRQLRLSILRNLLLVAFVISLNGCEKVENEPRQLAQTLNPAIFATYVNPIFDRNFNGKSCASSGCHNIDDGRGGRFKLNPNVNDTNSIEMTQNYLSALSFSNIDKPAASPLLLEPLTGSFAAVGPHGGGDIFTNVDDDNYLIIYQWIASPTPIADEL